MIIIHIKKRNLKSENKKYGIKYFDYIKFKDIKIILIFISLLAIRISW